MDSALILPAVMCDNTHRVLSAREAHLSCGVQDFTGGQSQAWSMTDLTQSPFPPEVKPMWYVISGVCAVAQGLR